MIVAWTMLTCVDHNMAHSPGLSDGENREEVNLFISKGKLLKMIILLDCGTCRICTTFSSCLEVEAVLKLQK